MTDFHVNGYVAQGFEPVRDVFAKSLQSGAEVGASFCVVRDGQTIVDLYGGARNDARSEPLGPDDLFNVWSTGKGLAALCLAMAVDRGLIDYDAPVAHYWPVFGGNGKAEITVEMLLSHASGVVGPQSPASIGDILDIEAMSTVLAELAPMFEPGSMTAYNANVMGHWVDALLRATDGRGVADFFAQEVAGPLGADVHIALPEKELHRRVPMIAPWAEMMGGMPVSKDPVFVSAIANPIGNPFDANDPAFMRAGHASAGTAANARGLARIYGALARGGEVDAIRIISPQALAQATKMRRQGKDRVFNMWVRWGAGFLLSNRGLYGPNDNSFGHSGWGGSFAFADPEAKLGIAYAMNLMAPSLAGDPRGAQLFKAVYDCLK